MNDAIDLKENYRGVFDSQMGFGRSPAIIVVDFIRAYTQPESPLYAPAVIAGATAVDAMQNGHLTADDPAREQRIWIDAVSSAWCNVCTQNWPNADWADI